MFHVAGLPVQDVYSPAQCGKEHLLVVDFQNGAYQVIFDEPVDDVLRIQFSVLPCRQAEFTAYPYRAVMILCQSPDVRSSMPDLYPLILPCSLVVPDDTFVFHA